MTSKQIRFANILATTASIIATLLLLAACSLFQSPAPAPTATASYTWGATSTPTQLPTKTIRPVTPTASSTPQPTLTPTTEPTQCPGTGIFCANGMEVKEFVGNYGGGVWSPGENTIVFVTNPAFKLALFSDPDFLPQDISFSQAGFGVSSDMIWSMDGKRIYFFAWDFNETDTWKAEFNTPWFADVSSKTILPLNMKFLERIPFIHGWMDSKILAVTGYCAMKTCFDLLDTRTGATVAYALFKGIPGRPNEKYLPVMHDNYASRLGIIGKEKTGATSFPDEHMEYTQWFSFDGLQNLDSAFFADWLPGTNQMLVSWVDGMDQETRLYLWDVDNNTTKPTIPNGLTGTFSPDGKVMAYLTDGPATLDNGRKPIAHTMGERKVFQPYLQLFDISSEQVFGSFPVSAKIDHSYMFPEYQVDFRFSPDGRYIAFLSDRAIALDESGWPVMPDENQAKATGTYLTVLDLQMRKIMLSQETNAFLPVWSPNGIYMVYQNKNKNLILFNVETGIETTLTKPVSEESRVKWSYDGSYLSIEVPVENWQTNLEIVKLP